MAPYANVLTCVKTDCAVVVGDVLGREDKRGRVDMNESGDLASDSDENAGDTATVRGMARAS